MTIVYRVSTTATPDVNDLEYRTAAVCGVDAATKISFVCLGLRSAAPISTARTSQVPLRSYSSSNCNDHIVGRQ